MRKKKIGAYFIVIFIAVTQLMGCSVTTEEFNKALEQISLSEKDSFGKPYEILECLWYRADLNSYSADGPKFGACIIYEDFFVFKQISKNNLDLKSSQIFPYSQIKSVGIAKRWFKKGLQFSNSNSTNAFILKKPSSHLNDDELINEAINIFKKSGVVEVQDQMLIYPKGMDYLPLTYK